MQKVLVVEDSKLFTQIVRRGVEGRLGYHMLHAATLAEARVLLAEHAQSILIALLDLHLPDAANGEIIDVVAAYKIPSVVFTGSFSDELREFVLSKHAVDYITKDSPGNFDLVLDLVSRINRNCDTSILVVDDSKVSRHYIQDLLTLHRFTVLQANGGDEALALVEAHPELALAIVDYNMPGMNGVELCRKIRAKRGRHDLVVIGVSAYGNNVVSAQFMKNGANDYLNKPFVPEEFFCRLYQNLDQVERIGALQRAEKQLRETAAAAQAANDAKTSVITHLSHELNSPLNAVMGFAQLLLSEHSPLAEREKSMVGNILKAGILMRDLITDILDIARVESGHVELQESPLDLSILASEIVAMMGPAAIDGGIRLHAGPPAAELRINADPKRLRQVLVNLLSNAIKFTPSGGEVSLEITVDPLSRLKVAVRDTGCGMDPAGIATALLPFGQLGPQHQRAKGLGLGLPLAKSLVELHQGEFSVDSALGQGTTVSFTLPAERLLHRAQTLP